MIPLSLLLLVICALSLSSFFPLYSVQLVIMFIDLFREPVFWLDQFFPHFFFMTLISTLIFNSFLLFAFGLICSFFFKVRVYVIPFRYFFFYNIYVSCYKFPSKHSFSIIPQISICCVLIFILLKDFFFDL